MLQSLKKPLYYFSFIELIYLLILPFMGYIGTGILNGKFQILPFLGIGILIIYQMIGYAFWVVNTQEKSKINNLFLPVSIVITLTNYVWLNENFWLFWVEKTLFEISAVFISFAVIALMGLNYRSKNILKELRAIFSILFILLLFSSSLFEVAIAWIKHVSYLNFSNKIHILSVFISLILDVLWLYPLLYKFHKREIVMKDLSNTKYGMTVIIVELITWVLIIPLTLYVAGYL